MFTTLIVSIFFVLALVLILGLRMDYEYERGVIFRLGRFKHIKGPGLYWIIPVIDQKVKIDIRVSTVSVESQETVTRDSVTIKVNAVLFSRVADPSKAIISVKSFEKAVYQAALTTLRTIIGQHFLDEVLKDRSQINISIRNVIDEIVAPWGLKVDLVEIKDIEIPQTMQRAMAKEAEAVREKRARIIKAEAELESSLKLSQAAQEVSSNPMALELRRMQMLTEIGIENNTTTIVMMPSEFVTAFRQLKNN